MQDKCISLLAEHLNQFRLLSEWLSKTNGEINERMQAYDYRRKMRTFKKEQEDVSIPIDRSNAQFTQTWIKCVVLVLMPSIQSAGKNVQCVSTENLQHMLLLSIFMILFLPPYILRFEIHH